MAWWHADSLEGRDVLVLATASLCTSVPPWGPNQLYTLMSSMSGNTNVRIACSCQMHRGNSVLFLFVAKVNLLSNQTYITSKKIPVKAYCGSVWSQLLPEDDMKKKRGALAAIWF